MHQQQNRITAFLRVSLLKQAISATIKKMLGVVQIIYILTQTDTSYKNSPRHEPRPSINLATSHLSAAD
jgi:hypothetical protein